MDNKFTSVELYEYVKATMKTIAASVETEADNLHPMEVTALIMAHQRRNFNKVALFSTYSEGRPRVSADVEQLCRAAPVQVRGLTA